MAQSLEERIQARHARRKAERDHKKTVKRVAPPERTEIIDQRRGVYDLKNAFDYDYKTEKGLSEETIREISAEKEEPDWLLNKRLEALKIFNAAQNPSWGPVVVKDNIVEKVHPS